MQSPMTPAIGPHTIKPRASNARLRTACLAFALSLQAAAACAEEPADALLQRVTATYAALNSYSDTGSVLVEYGQDSKDRHRFATSFNRAPRRFLFDFRKQGDDDRLVVWGDPDAFHRWWKTTGETADYPNPNNTLAFTLSSYPTLGSITMIPSLLYHNAALVGSLSNLTELRLAGDETVGGRPCRRLVGRASDVYAESGREVNVHTLTLWIDVKTNLVRQVREESKAAPGMVDRTTTTYEPKADPALPENAFHFAPPAGS